MKRFALLLLGIASFAVPTHAHATVINSLPYTITAPGTYVLTHNMTFPSDQPLIFLQGPITGAVTIDFQGFTITAGPNPLNYIGVEEGERRQAVVTRILPNVTHVTYHFITRGATIFSADPGGGTHGADRRLRGNNEVHAPVSYLSSLHPPDVPTVREARGPLSKIDENAHRPDTVER